MLLFSKIHYLNETYEMLIFSLKDFNQFKIFQLLFSLQGEQWEVFYVILITVTGLEDIISFNTIFFYFLPQCFSANSK